jgi:predicted nucleotidyltransferase
MVSKTIENELVNGLLNIFGDNISKIILYGSVARNEETAESDVDIAVINIAPISDETRNIFIDWSSEMDLKYDRVFSIIDIEKERFDTWENILPFYKNVSREGIVLWSAA